MTVSKRLVIAFVSISVFVLALMGIAWSAMSDVLEVLKAGSLTAQQSQNLMAEVERSRWWLLALGAWVCISCTWSWISLRRRIVAPLQEAILIAETVAAGDLSKEFSSNAEGEFGRLLTALSTMEDTLTELVGRIKQSTDSLAVSAYEIDAGNINLSSRTEQQVSALTETAASMEQLTVTVRQNAERAHSASSLAVTASATAGRGGDVVDQVVHTMDAISGSSRKIVDIIQVIEGIAFQTNILALNAAVEAARAGEQGRGFAVVASEVRSLAQRSAEAAKQIKELITASVTQVESGSGLVGQAGSTMKEIMQSVGQVTGLLSEISGALQQQSEGIAHVNTAVAHMDSTNQENAALVMQATQAAAALNARTQDLQQAVGAFKLDDDESPGLAPSAMPAPRGAGAAQARPARARELAYEEL
ncbi:MULTISPECIES: methyl-accepting chemotaxis protein [Comamonas]|uniref:methyl-accepting chemotaxis protein n=1 Tax=Comamonas TaxID=283 RepID=UPI000556A614|nr:MULTISPECIES: methyl-accepting chemotaxis protein [Comamonas]MCO8247441.1 methyl-accepting chemotaxis protein [Comamonas thiooxydans]OAD84878.1 chemotaxis protein [Comamonas thiooxydans]TZG12405.1 methyl-accepting chemotaxis protein [Comamonas thiooxydans]UBQ42753.1 methyl-accepting chemotaxis protein [Comamonas thiooxydans]UNV90177.1 methyl-accepting chemotaxis protein [Comamonas sp. 7D-2evo1]